MQNSRVRIGRNGAHSVSALCLAEEVSRSEGGTVLMEKLGMLDVTMLVEKKTRVLAMYR